MAEQRHGDPRQGLTAQPAIDYPPADRHVRSPVTIFGRIQGGRKELVRQVTLVLHQDGQSDTTPQGSLVCSDDTWNVTTNAPSGFTTNVITATVRYWENTMQV